jgi:PIN domain nuclease of toxin-antitoxin system
VEGHEVIVVDTHVILWDALKPELLSKKAKEAMAQANEGTGIIFCEISLWEIAMLVQKERIRIEASYQDFIKWVFSSNKYQFQGITPEIAELSAQFPEEMNKDHADRIVAATSLIRQFPLVTADSNLNQSHLVSTIW